MNKLGIIFKGIFKENPVFVLALGMCPTLATTSSGLNGMSMGLATTFVLMLSNMTISLMAAAIPEKVRIPAYIVVIAAFVTVVDLLIKAYLPAVYSSLGIFIPLIVVNCIVLARAESFASKNGAFDSMLDGIGIGLGFTLALTLLGCVREILGANEILGLRLIQELEEGGALIFGLFKTASVPSTKMILFILAPGAFIVLGYLVVLVNMLRNKFSKS